MYMTRLFILEPGAYYEFKNKIQQLYLWVGPIKAHAVFQILPSFSRFNASEICYTFRRDGGIPGRAQDAAGKSGGSLRIPRATRVHH